MKKYLVLFISLYMCYTVSAQFGISYQLSTSNSKIGVSYDFNQKFGAHVGMYDGVLVRDFTIDAAVKYNFINRERHDLYVGAGGIVNFFDGIIVPVGVRFRPIKDFSKFSLQIEALPMYEFNVFDLIFFCTIGVQYKFGKEQ